MVMFPVACFTVNGVEIKALVLNPMVPVLENKTLK
jgi:hypothetical protein